MKTYIGTKQVKAEPMDELAAVEKGYARKNEDTTNGGRATTFSTPTRMVAPTTHGLPRTCLSVRTTCVMRNRLQWYVFL